MFVYLAQSPFFSPLKGVRNVIVQTDNNSCEKSALYTTNLAGYKYYLKYLNKLKHTCDGLNVALVTAEHAKYENIHEDELATMEIPAPEHQKTEQKVYNCGTVL